MITPAFADEFGGLDYYQEEPLPIIRTYDATTPIDYQRTNNDYEVRSTTLGYSRELTTVRAGIAGAIAYAVSQAGTPHFSSALDEIRTRASLGANLSDDVIECIICAICSNEDDPNIAEQKALAILDEALEQENRNNDYSNGGGSRAGGAMPPDDNDKYKKPKSGSGKDKATDIPSWAKGERPYTGENGKNFANRLMNERYGKGNWENNANRMREFRQLQKNGDRGYR